MIVNCATCNAELERMPYQIKASKTGNFFCNRECRSKWDSEKWKKHRENFPEIKCEICGKNKKVKPYRVNTQRYCSYECSNKARHLEGTTLVNCSFCHKEFRKNNFYVNNYDNLFCSKDCHGKWISEESLNKRVSVFCEVCGVKDSIIPSKKSTYKTCSKKCHNIRLKRVSSTDEWIDQMRENGMKGLKSQQQFKETEPERLVREYLEENGITFEPQKEMYGKFMVDFFLPENNTVLEVFGDYWHGNPEVYNTKKPLNEMQINQIKKDKSRKSYLETCGHNFLHVWEKDIYEDIEEAMKVIR